MKIKICKKVTFSLKVKLNVYMATAVLGRSVLLWIFPLPVQPPTRGIVLPTVLCIPWTQLMTRAPTHCILPTLGTMNDQGPLPTELSLPWVQ